YGAADFMQLNMHTIVTSIGKPKDNLAGNLWSLAIASDGYKLVALAARSLTLTVWGLAVLGTLRRIRAGGWDVRCVALAIAPFALLAGNAYGGEILFRVYLYTLPFMTLMVAGLFYPSPSGRSSRWTAVAAGACSIGFFAVLCFAYYGRD